MCLLGAQTGEKIHIALHELPISSLGTSSIGCQVCTQKKHPFRRVTPLCESQVFPDQNIENELHMFGYQLGVVQNSPRGYKPKPYAWRYSYEQNMRDSYIHILPNDTDSRRRELDQLWQTDRLKAIMIESPEGSSLGSRLRKVTRTEPMYGILIDSAVREGDIVVQFLGSRMVHVVRPSNHPGKFSLVCAGWFWYRDSGVRELLVKATDRIEDKRWQFHPTVEVYLCEDIHHMGDVLRWEDRALGRGARFRTRILEIIGFSDDEPETSRPELTLFKLV